MPVNSHSKIAFVGTGIMGSAIAGHILDAGYDVTVTNRTKAKAEGLLARGAAWADTPAEAAKDADVVFTMVGYPTDVEDVYLSTDGLIRVAKRGAWLIDLTTSSPQLARDIHDAAEVEDKHAFDCPVTGGQKGAEDGTLTLIVGASEEESAPVLPILETFSSKIMYFDQPGGGQTAKLCNQVSLASCMVGYADALALAEQAGIDQRQVLELMANGTGGSGASKALAPRPWTATTSPASWWSTCARTSPWRSSAPRTWTWPCRVRRPPSPCLTCSARLAAPAWAPRPSRCSTPTRPQAPRPALTGRCSTPRTTAPATAAAAATCMATAAAEATARATATARAAAAAATARATVTARATAAAATATARAAAATITRRRSAWTPALP